MFSYLLRGACTALLALGCTSVVHAGAIDNITVGQAGLAGNCTVATIQAAINLAAQHPGPDTIWVSRDTPDGYYLATSALSISNQDVEIIGGFDDCFDETPSGFTDISGNGNAADPVFRIRGTGAVRLQNLTITLGDADNNEGSGIDYAGNGVLELADSIIEYNNSSGDGNGGGIRFSGINGGGDLVIVNSRINNNTARNGGGIAFEGAGRFIVNNTAIHSNSARGDGGGAYLSAVNGAVSAYLEQGVTISANSAADDGGGLFVGENVGLEWNGADGEMWSNAAGDLGGGINLDGGATADIFTRGRLFPPTGQYHAVFSGNTARHGGGISAATFNPKEIRLRLSSFDGETPQYVANNSATENGGAFYLKAYTNGALLGRSELCLLDTVVANNLANRGAGVYAQRSVDGSDTYGNWIVTQASSTNSCRFDTPRPRCGRGKECSSFQNNHSTVGAVIDSEGGSTAYVGLDRTKFVGNSGSNLVYMGSGSNSTVDMRTNLIVLNSFTQGAIRVDNGELKFIQNTVADNTASNVILDTRVREQFRIARNILLQPGFFALNLHDDAVPTGSIVDNLSSDQTMASIDASNFSLDPRFALGYRLLPGSPAIDAAISGISDDLAGYQRPIDLPSAPNRGDGTTADLGAYELQSIPQDALFSHGFE